MNMIKITQDYTVGDFKLALLTGDVEAQFVD